MATDKIHVILSATDRASGVFSRVGDVARTMDTKTGGFVKRVKNLATQINQYGAPAVLALGGALGFCAYKALEQEKAEALLNKAMQNAGTYTDTAFKALKDYAKQLQDTTIYSDEQYLSAMTLFSSFGMSPELIKPATMACADLATALGVDLDSASKMMVKAFQGNNMALSRWGIKADETLEPGARFQNLIEQINGKLGGMAIAAGETTAGKLEILKNKLSDLAASIGEGVLPVVNFLADSLSALFDRSYDPSQATGAFAEWTGAMNGLLVVFANVQVAWDETVRLMVLGIKDLATIFVHTPANIGGAFSDMRDKAGRALDELDTKMADSRTRILDMNGSGQQMRDQVSAAFTSMSSQSVGALQNMYTQFQTAQASGNPQVADGMRKGMEGILSSQLAAMPFIEGNQTKLMERLVQAISTADFHTAPRDKIYEMARSIQVYSGTPLQQVEQLLLGLQGEIAGSDWKTPTLGAAMGIPSAIDATAPTANSSTQSLMQQVDGTVRGWPLATQPVTITGPTNQENLWAQINSFWAGKTAYYSVQGKPGSALGFQTGGYVGQTGGYLLHEGEVVLPPQIVNQIKQGKSNFTPSAQNASMVSSGGGITINLSAGAFMGTPGEARRFAALINGYLKQENAR